MDWRFLWSSSAQTFNGRMNLHDCCAVIPQRKHFRSASGCCVDNDMNCFTPLLTRGPRRIQVAFRHLFTFYFMRCPSPPSHLPSAPSCPVTLSALFQPQQASFTRPGWNLTTAKFASISISNREGKKKCPNV